MVVRVLTLRRGVFAARHGFNFGFDPRYVGHQPAVNAVVRRVYPVKQSVNAVVPDWLAQYGLDPSVAVDCRVYVVFFIYVDHGFFCLCRCPASLALRVAGLNLTAKRLPSRKVSA